VAAVAPPADGNRAALRTLHRQSGPDRARRRIDDPEENFMRLAVFASSLALASAALAAPALAAVDPGKSAAPDGYVTIVSKSADIGVGASWGSGTLTFHHHKYAFSVKGVDVAAVGYSKVTGHGRVYDLKNLHDFDGTYAAADGEATVGKGLGGQVLKNGNGVELRIDNMTKGARLAGAAQGIELTLDDSN
jgi:hypothetical protein